MIKAVIFDWDGVIEDSMILIAKAIQETAHFYGVEVGLEEVQNDYFQPREKYYQSLGIKIEKHPDLGDTHVANVAKLHNEANIFPDVITCLHSLHQKGIQLGIASNSPRDYILQKLNDFELKDIFPANLVIGAGALKEDKLNELIKLLNLNKEEILYIGDLPTDIATAKIVGVKSAGIARQEKPKKRLQDEDPDYLFNSLAELNLLF